MRIDKKYVLAAAAIAAGLAASAHAADKTRIALLTWNDSEGRYKAVREAIVSEAAKGGWDASKAEWSVEDVRADKARTAAAVKKVRDSKPAAIVSLGTTPTVALAKDETKTPIVFSLVFDPVEAGVAKSWEGSERNTTGSANFVSIPKFLRRLQESVPVKRLGVLYTPGQKNSEIILESIKSSQALLKLEAVPIEIRSPQDIVGLAPKLDKLDALFLPAALHAGDGVPKIVEMAVKRKLVTLTNIEDYVGAGVMIGLAVDPEAMGRLAGRKLVEVLGGAAPSSIRIEYPTPGLVLNAKTAEAMGYSFPDGLKQWATKTIK